MTIKTLRFDLLLVRFCFGTDDLIVTIDSESASESESFEFNEESSSGAEGLVIDSELFDNDKISCISFDANSFLALEYLGNEVAWGNWLDDELVSSSWDSLDSSISSELETAFNLDIRLLFLFVGCSVTVAVIIAFDFDFVWRVFFFLFEVDKSNSGSPSESLFIWLLSSLLWFEFNSILSRVGLADNDLSTRRFYFQNINQKKESN